MLENKEEVTVKKWQRQSAPISLSPAMDGEKVSLVWFFKIILFFGLVFCDPVERFSCDPLLPTHSA